AGVIGLAVAAEIANNNLDIFILEKNESYGRGISSRNSEVIHSGIYYPTNSLKARLCIEGKKLLYEICEKNNIPYKKTGKLIIATIDSEIQKVQSLYQNAQQNGVTSVQLFGKEDIKKMEPYVYGVSALYSPDTGILSVHHLMDYFLMSAKKKGAEIVYDTEVIDIEQTKDGYRIATKNKKGELFNFTSARVINSAGLQSDTIAKMVGKDYALNYCKGDYFSINRPVPVKRLVYPVPEERHTGLGIHLTIDLNGRARLGPDVQYIERKEDYRIDKEKIDIFYKGALRYLPFLKKEDLSPDMSGIRPKLQGPNDSFRDFVISEDLPGFINLVGIESPGLTASPAIARYVKKMLSN
ncbi:MAG: NAD(P)/FAD-dependent oxidoreductase, partial [Thermodesulfovibrionales bacterium]